MHAPQINLLVAWVWILLGFASGTVMGLFFHRDDWMGGYGSFKRRLYRLAHISFFGLGAVNLGFYFTVRAAGSGAAIVPVASWAFVVGAISMPLCCYLMAHFPRARLLFGLPVISLLLGGVFTAVSIFQSIEASL